MKEDQNVAGGMSLQEAQKIVGVEAKEVDGQKLREVSSIQFSQTDDIIIIITIYEVLLAAISMVQLTFVFVYYT